MAEDDLPIEARLVGDLIAWLERQGLVPMLVAARGAVVGDMPGVPADAAHVVLNVSSRAIRHLELGREAMSFSTAFGPTRTTLSIPWGAILQVGSAEGEGFVGGVLRHEAEASTPPPPASDPEPKRRFRIVREDEG